MNIKYVLDTYIYHLKSRTVEMVNLCLSVSNWPLRYLSKFLKPGPDFFLHVLLLVAEHVKSLLLQLNTEHCRNITKMRSHTFHKNNPWLLRHLLKKFKVFRANLLIS